MNAINDNPTPGRSRSAWILSMLLLSAAPASSMTITTGSVEGASGGKVKIPLQVEDAVKLGVIQMELSYDADLLEFQGTREGTFEQNVTADVRERAPGRLFILCGTSARETVNEDGVLTNLVFLVKGENGASCMLALENVAAWYDEKPDIEALAANVSPVDGSFTIKGTAVPMEIWIGAALAVIAVMVILKMMKRRGKSEPRASAKGGDATEAIYCHQCHQALSDGAKFCPGCGTPIQEKSAKPRCVKCATELGSDAKFCPECGTPQ